MNLLNNNPIPQKLEGVEGFLLLLCFSLTILSPLMNSILIYRNLYIFKNIEYLMEIDFYYAVIQLVPVILNIVLILVSIIAGILLWRKNKTGLILAKILFISNISLNLISLFLMYSQGNSPVDFPRSTISGILIPLAWLIYLYKSERVKNTFK